MPTNSSRLNVVARLKSIRPARNNRTSSRYSGIGVRPVASPRTIEGFRASAHAMSAANARASAFGVVKILMRNDAFPKRAQRNDLSTTEITEDAEVIPVNRCNHEVTKTAQAILLREF